MWSLSNPWCTVSVQPGKLTEAVSNLSLSLIGKVVTCGHCQTPGALQWLRVHEALGVWSALDRHARTHTCMHAHTHMQSNTHPCMHTHTHMHTRTHTHMHTHTRTHTHTHMHTHTHTHTHAVKHTHMHAHTHACTHTCTHTHMHTHTYTHTQISMDTFKDSMFLNSNVCLD